MKGIIEGIICLRKQYSCLHKIKLNKSWRDIFFIHTKVKIAATNICKFLISVGNGEIDER